VACETSNIVASVVTSSEVFSTIAATICLRRAFRCTAGI
jgi:hypothetical protein